MKLSFDAKCTRKILLAIVALTILFFTSKLMLEGAGYSGSERNSLLMCSLIIILSSSRKAFNYIIIPMCILYALYTPIGLMFGKPSYQSIASVLATDLLESEEFINQIPIVNYVKSALIILGIISFRLLTNRTNIKLYKNKTVLSLLIFFALIDQSPFSFFRDILESINNVQTEKEQLSKMMVDSKWGPSHLSANSKYENYVLVIGESARRDYHNAYGYPINNTPFMSNENGILVDGLSSAGTNTISSLRLMLTMPSKNGWEPRYQYNLIDLIKSANIKTYWISNQGFMGESDTPISAIANRSDSKFFLKYGSYESKNTSDFELLPQLKNILNIKENEKKFIVIHLYGSHPNACHRVKDFNGHIDDISDSYQYSYLSCYVLSIKKTDEILRKINDELKENQAMTGQSYSLIYFSDHGQTHDIKDNKIIMGLSKTGKYSYNIPLFMTASDSTSQKICNTFKSGLNFTESIANWVGIINPHISSEYDLFNCSEDKNDFGLFEKINNLQISDPAIDIRKSVPPA